MDCMIQFFGGNGDEINETRFNSLNRYFVAFHSIDKCVDRFTHNRNTCQMLYNLYHTEFWVVEDYGGQLLCLALVSFLSLIHFNFCIGIKMIEHNIWFLKCSSFHSMVTQEINRDFVGDRVQWCHLIHIASWPHLVKKCFGGGGDSRYFGE